MLDDFSKRELAAIIGALIVVCGSAGGLRPEQVIPAN
jgi:hypothetical protein